MEATKTTAQSDLLTTGDVAREAGNAADTVRYWERTGLLKATRTASGQRLFRREDVEAFLAKRRSLSR